MSDPQFSEPEAGGAGRDEIMSARFAQMVMQQVNLAMMLLGKTPHPQTGQAVRDLEGARMFIDQLEMIEAKTKGNLSKEEQTFLQQSLMSLHLAFVETAESPAPPDSAARPAEPAAGPSGSAAASEPSAAEAEPSKKFSKKY
jgi:Domain of unknown function (DUF1844)